MVTMAAPAKPDAADRARKKPRLSPATTVASSHTATSSRLKSGLLPPTAVGASSSSSSSTRLHYAFGSRLPPMAGKENAPTNTASAAKPTATANKHDAALKKHEPPKSAVKRVGKKRLSDEPTATPTAKTSAPSTPATSDTEGLVSTEPKEPTLSTPEVAAKPLAPPVLLSPAKPVRFEATTATDPDFWKCRQQFARTAMLQLKELEDRLNALSESPSLPVL